jgi:hypothetical protein
MQPMSGVALAASLLLALAASADTLYKLIDRNGKVTYSESPPKNFDGKVIRLDINPDANVTPGLPKADAAPTELTGLRPPPAAKSDPSAATRVQEAKGRLEAAKLALQDAIDNPREGEIERIGKVGGGTRPVFSPAYEERIAKLESNVRLAEEMLRQAEQGGRPAAARANDNTPR